MMWHYVNNNFKDAHVTIHKPITISKLSWVGRGYDFSLQINEDCGIYKIRVI